MRIDSTPPQSGLWTGNLDTPARLKGQATSADLIDCPATGYFGAVVEPAVFQVLPEQSSKLGKIINNLTNVYGLFESINSDLCTKGRLGVDSAGASLEFMARSFTSVVAGFAGATLAGFGSLLGPAGTAAGIGTGIFLLKEAPPLAGRIARGGLDLFNDLIARTKDYLDDLRANNRR